MKKLILATTITITAIPALSGELNEEQKMVVSSYVSSTMCSNGFESN
ncbi:hypothetical protein [Vibrio gallicus]|nr:hypothetical protein [Vibrio gallicus]